MALESHLRTCRLCRDRAAAIEEAVSTLRRWEDQTPTLEVTTEFSEGWRRAIHVSSTAGLGGESLLERLKARWLASVLTPRRVAVTAVIGLWLLAAGFHLATPGIDGELEIVTNTTAGEVRMALRRLWNEIPSREAVAPQVDSAPIDRTPGAKRGDWREATMGFDVACGSRDGDGCGQTS
jgi:hypothetical protein